MAPVWRQDASYSKSTMRDFFLFSGLLRWGSVLLLALSLSSCQREKERSGESQILKLGVDNRVEIGAHTLEGPNDIQHVSRVILYVFDGTDPESECVAREEVNWSFAAQAVQGSGTQNQVYQVKFPGFVNENRYTLLAVGLDEGVEVGLKGELQFQGNNSTRTYGLPGAITYGTTLAQANAVLQTGCRVSDIACSELYAGFCQVQGGDFLSSGSRDSIVLNRRVAGVMAYLKEVPAQYKGQDVGSVRVMLGSAQNTSVPLLRKDNQQGIFLDYIDSPSDEPGSEVLLEFHAVDYPLDTGEIRTLSKGVFVLPFLPSGPRTLLLQVLDREGNLIHEFSLLDPTFQDGAVYTPQRYPLVANHFYSLGSASHPVDLLDYQFEFSIQLDSVWDEYYGGNLGEDPFQGIGVDEEWGGHDAGNIL